MKFSYWEHKEYQFKDSIVIIGSGIVGLSTAISLKHKLPDKSVIIIDRQFPPKGASTKNAGFICFGSVSEILDDLDNMSLDECKELIKLRWNGSQILKDRIGSIADMCGGFELFDKNKFPSDFDINYLNSIFNEAIGIKDFFKKVKNNHFPKFNDHMISMPQEGQLNPMDMIKRLHSICKELGIKFVIGIEVEKIDQENLIINCKNDIRIPFAKCIIATNGFTKNYLSNTETIAVRNLVLVSKELENINWEGVFHYNKGYYYFRKHNKRLLIGGARNQDIGKETTDQFGINSKIYEHLTKFSNNFVLDNMKFDVEFEWSGILGVGASKKPLIKELNKDIFMGIRLGGMGVAIGSQMGESLSELVKDSYVS